MTDPNPADVRVVRPALNWDRPSIGPEYGLATITVETVVYQGQPVAMRRVQRLGGGPVVMMPDSAPSGSRAVATPAEIDRMPEIAREPSTILETGWTRRIRQVCQLALEGDFADLVRAHRDARVLCAKPTPSYAERALLVATEMALVEEIAFARSVDKAAAEAELAAAFAGVV
jgi:RNA polymerase-interacting CarD/CdnL/TRCF family regulator